MAILDTLVTTAAGTLFATAGVVVGGVVTRQAQDRQWLRDKQLVAYEEGFGRAIDPFLGVAGGPAEQPLTEEEFERASLVRRRDELVQGARR